MLTAEVLLPVLITAKPVVLKVVKARLIPQLVKILVVQIQSVKAQVFIIILVVIRRADALHYNQTT